jgi:23S rRNA pseudouridine2605 synthase
MTPIRLNKYLASMGVASRRKIDEMTSSNRITINNKTAVLGDKVDPDTDTITVDKKVIPPHPQTLVYYLLNKPKYVLSTSSDDRGRDTVLNYLPKDIRVFPVGRLDYESTGAII